MYTIVGLGNPGEEYRESRHNTGRMVALFIAKKAEIELIPNKKFAGQYGKGEIEGESVQIILPDTFMNKSGKSVSEAVKSKKAAEKLVVIYDDLDLPVGKMKISFNRSSGGHKGLESIIRVLKTEAFIRIRIGISPVTPSGKIKKPLGDEKVLKHVMAKFSPKEFDEVKKIFKKSDEFIRLLILKDLSTAMSQIAQ
jgi:peptidyl-tRNA hydrolase, PTH1 family